MKAIILAGGFGTRLRPLTETMPKPLLPIGDKPIIEHAILNFKKHGIKDIVISIGYMSEMIKGYFGNGSHLGVNISYEVEDQPLGTGGALKRASDKINGTFLAINGDNLADFDWTDAILTHKNTNSKITLSLFPVEDVTQFGIAKLEEGKILEFIEKPTKEKAPSNLNNAGGYIINQGVLDMLPDGKSSVEKDCFEKLAVLGVVGAHIHKYQWYPTDTIEKYNFANNNFKSII